MSAEHPLTSIRDSVDTRSLGGATFGSATQNASTCITFCDARGYSVAGTEYGSECKFMTWIPSASCAGPNNFEATVVAQSAMPTKLPMGARWAALAQLPKHVADPTDCPFTNVQHPPVVRVI
jgi:hypothetical protein